MSRRRPLRHIQPKHSPKKSVSTFILLDQFSAGDIRKWAAFKDHILKYHWDYYNDLTYQRSKIAEQIKKSILEATQKTFRFTNWQRAVKFKYVLEPFSVAGSLVDPGGRFNIGDINPSQFQSFPALYLAADKDTAFQELLSQNNAGQGNGLDPFDFALTKPDSVAIISLSGTLDSIINLREPDKFSSFVNLIKNFSISDNIKQVAKKIGFPEPDLVRTIPKLMDCLLDPNWREWPMQFDVPFPSQIFGQLVVEAGVEGILYPSKFTGKDCLVIFPQNFDDDSFIQLDDEAPAGIKIRRLDGLNAKIS